MEASPFDSRLGEEQAMIANAVKEFADDVVRPAHEALDHAGTHPEELFGQLAELGLFGVFAPEDAGGTGAGALGHAVVVETLARAAGTAGGLVAAQGVATHALLHAKSPAEELEGLLAGEILGAPALAELDDARLATRAEGGEDTVKVSGHKTNVPFPGRAGVLVVLAERLGEPVLVKVLPNADGVAFTGPDPVLGLSGLEVGTLRLENVEGRILGGREQVEKLFGFARISVSALLAGIARGAVDHAARYAVERQQFNLELRRFGAMQERLARADARAEAMRGLVHGAAAALDAGHPAAEAARRARLFAQETAIACADDAVQVYGGFGYSREYPVERFYRDAAFPGFGEHWHPRAVHQATEALT